jgi:hypothetical protein
MPTQYHILNGDALLEQFPSNIEGGSIVCRECLIIGNVRGESLAEFYETRAKFISDQYDTTVLDYKQKVVTEFNKIQNIENDAEINLWFEDDLFCQVNFWFILHLINQYGINANLFLVRPTEKSPYSFGSYNQSELTSMYSNRIQLSGIENLLELWPAYKKDHTGRLLLIARKIKHIYPFILKAVNAHIDRIPTDAYLGRPKQALIQIMKDLKTKEFGIVFREFSKREGIYGFGDTQVKALLIEIENIEL